MKHYNIPVFISHFGCPNSCVFCNQKKINGRETDVTMEDLKNTIEMYLINFNCIICGFRFFIDSISCLLFYADHFIRR